MMSESFMFNDSVHNLLFYGWTTHHTWDFVLTCVAVFSVAFLIEGIKVLRNYAALQAEKSPLEYEASKRTNSERPAFLNPLLIPVSLQAIKRRRFAYKFLCFVTYVLQIVLTYAMMLFVMTYNAWFLIATCSGYMLGYFVFSGLNIDPVTTSVGQQWTDHVNS